MLYIMRHGQTDWNKECRLQGRSDIPLNDEGRRMAKAAREKYQNLHFDICFCSSLIRARETAEIFLSGRNIPIIPDDRLIEMSFGIYEGITDYFDNAEGPIHVLFTDPDSYTEPAEGAESIDELFDRTGEFLRECAYPLLKEGKDVLIVGHGAMNSSIVCQVKNLPRSSFLHTGFAACEVECLGGGF